MPKSFEDLFEESRDNLLNFLRTEVDLGITFADMAQGYRDQGNLTRYETNKQNANAAFEAIEHFKGRLSDIARVEIERDSSRLAEIIAIL